MDVVRSLRVWTQEEINWLKLVSEFIAISQARRQAEEALRESAKRESAITKAIQQMRQTLELETIFSTTTQELRRVMECDRVLIYRFNPDCSGEFVSEAVATGWKVLMQNAIEQTEPTQIGVDEDCAVKTFDSQDNLIQDTYLQETQGGNYRQGKSYTCVSDIYEAGFDPCWTWYCFK